MIDVGIAMAAGILLGTAAGLYFARLPKPYKKEPEPVDTAWLAKDLREKEKLRVLEGGKR